MDTLQKVRETGSENYSYSMDYQNITALKLFSDRNNVAILVVHHTRKMEASDSFDMISGTNGLLGAADGAFILQKKKRTDPTRTTQTSNKQDDRSGHNVVEALLTYDGEGYTIDWTKLEQKLADQQTTLMIRCPHDLVGKICI